MADTLLGGIVINEVLVDPNSTSNNFDTDGNGVAAATDEFVEIANTSNAPIDVSGVQLWDSANENWFTFPSGTVLQPGAHAVVIAGVQSGGSLPNGGPDDLAFDAGRGTAVLNNGPENIVLYDPGTDTFIQTTYNGDVLDDPVADYTGFSPTATRIGSGENFGSDIDGFSIQRAPDGSDTFANDETPTPGDFNICFGNDALILTPEGERTVASLLPGDLVETKDFGPRPIRWVGRRRIGEQALVGSPQLLPIRLAAGTLGEGLPRRDLLVSQQHRIVVRGPIAVRMFDSKEVLVAAVHLLGVDGIEVTDDVTDINYVHLMLDQHQIIFAEGAETESLYAGAQALHGIDRAGLEELFQIFPELRTAETPPRPARRLIGGRDARELARRHVKNGKFLFDPR
ncbi:MAG: Hint domain-containing protein [Pseudomonadota bacterium]